MKLEFTLTAIQCLCVPMRGEWNDDKQDHQHTVWEDAYRKTGKRSSLQSRANIVPSGGGRPTLVTVLDTATP